MKSFTDIEQSKKLIELGIDVNTADMYWKNGVSDKYIQCFTPFVCGDYQNGLNFDYDIPAWSLTALLNIFPCSKESPIVNLTRGGWNPSFTRHWFATWEDEDKNVFYSCDGISPVDAVVELILKLHEEKLL